MKLSDTFTEAHREKRLTQTKRDLVIANKSLFFSVAAYFRLREHLDIRIKGIDQLVFNSASYYSDKAYKNRLLLSFTKLTFMRTIQVIRKASTGDDVYNWLRQKGNQEIFFDNLATDYGDSIDLEDEYREFVEQFKI